MTAKEYLSQYRHLDASINAKLEQMRRMRELSVLVSPSQSDGGRSGCTSDRVGNIVAKIADLSAEINADIDKLVDLQREITAVIDRVPDPRFRLLLTEYYINCKTWEQVAVDMGYTWRHTMRLHGFALANLHNVIVCHI